MFQRQFVWLIFPAIAILIGLSNATLYPGVYMDAVSPDFVVARLVSSNPANVIWWTLPGNLLFDKLPVLSHIYYGALGAWIGLPFYLIFGTDVIGIRITHIAFAFLIVLSAWWMLVRMRVEAWIAAYFLAAMSIDPAFHFIFRTQFHSTALPVAFLFMSLALMVPTTDRKASVDKLSLVCSGVAAGLSAYGYFIYYFYSAVIALFILSTRRRRVIYPWFAGILLGVMPIVIGLLLFSHAMGKVGAIFDMANTLQTFQAESGLWVRFNMITSLAELAYNGQGANLMMLNDTVAASLGWMRTTLLIVIPTLILVALEVLRRPTQEFRKLFLLLTIPPLIYGMIFGTRLWVQHFVPVVPLVYCFAAVAYGQLFNLINVNVVIRRAVLAGSCSAIAPDQRK
jgi:hypothetical protein